MDKFFLQIEFAEDGDFMRINDLEKKTFLMLLMTAFFHGFVMSVFNIQDGLAKKALDTMDWQITILTMLWPLSNLFSIWWGKLLEHSKSLSVFFLLIGFIGRLSLILMLWVHNYYQFLFIMVIVFSFNALLSPAQNAIYQHNITEKNRGKFFGYAASIVTLISIISSYFAGKALDQNEDSFRYLLMFAGVAGFISSVFLASIKLKNKKYIETPLRFGQLIFSPIYRSIEILKKNKNFAIFQRNFFIYGIGFMIILPAIPKYLVENLEMTYSQIFLAKGVISQIGILFLAPVAGIIHNRQNPVKFASITFFTLGLYPLILLISTFFVGTIYANYIVYFAFLIFGIAMSGMVISWSISSLFFAKDDDVSMYQSVHVTLTGLRGIIFPFMGYFILKFFGIKVVFSVSILMFWTASILSISHYLKMADKKIKYPRKMKFILHNLRKIFPVGL